MVPLVFHLQRDLTADKIESQHEIGAHMKSMTCKQLAGACDLVFTAETFEEIAKQSQQHGREMLSANDEPHVAAMEQMMELMKSGAMEAWMAERQADFDAP